ncbi:hypothetical protein GCM10027413_13960 [Conyzicola nivalis]|uniref:Uncharacterized protein n=1 Tax=Conyzicola nivalis TaxID=1477021 RepID=A0A916SGH0_9MICO|nr:hypothetical protein [Conyzicola nivalis]GGA99668.1 hypothetical protein GCM10010979_12670 [Conyzicola nivalis]
MTDPNFESKDPELSVRGHFIASVVALLLAIAWTGFPMLAEANGTPLRGELGGYFLASVGFVGFAVWLAATGVTRQLRARRAARRGTQ